MVIRVASHADAWIEIIIAICYWKRSNCRIPRGCVDWNVSPPTTNNICWVASHADAWIEIKQQYELIVSLPVASHADAWIEISLSVSAKASTKSHPTRMRGLKFTSSCNVVVFKPSHPTRMRGLKCWIGIQRSMTDLVASHADAWIEILLFSCPFSYLLSHPTRMRGLKSHLKKY